MSTVAAVIPSWNTCRLLGECLRALSASTHAPGAIVVVDNGSSDSSAELVAAQFPGANLLRNERNEGFARACNQGIAASASDYVLLLNADARLEPQALGQMVEFLDAHAEYGGCAPQLRFPDGTLQRSCLRFPTLGTALFFGTPLGSLWPSAPALRHYQMVDFDHESERDVEQPAAAVWLLRRSALDAVEGFDEDLWLFFNDVDLALRLQRAGWATRFLPSARAAHELGASTSQFPAFLDEWHANRLAYYRKHFGWIAGPWLKACVAGSFVGFVIAEGARRLRGRRTRDIGPLARSFGRFLLR